MRMTVERDEDMDISRSDTGSNNCYDNAVKIPEPKPDTDASRRYNCQPPQFSQVPLTATALASSPGSGSTWLRYLLQQATGIYTGSVYHDTALADAGFYGENITDSRVVVIKTHRERELQKYDRAILVIRDPYDAIVSEYNWRVSEHWHRFNSKWLDEFQGPLHVVFYEDMVDNLAMSLRNIIAFLGVPGTRIYCALRSPNGNFWRKPANIASRYLFTRAQRTVIDGYQENVYEYVVQQQGRLRARMLE
ncbi:hypothetical protein NP493_436g02019 [Ridgeia piscesae]|uniref:Sulfotransferase n=1 Tax=Ridgeia piscesae TaxID=27915 RepID=A0AAD9KZL3_RIDPI|nr:hypothetical protein NP493_436g02019 [Ridgeia piscesae]